MTSNTYMYINLYSPQLKTITCTLTFMIIYTEANSQRWQKNCFAKHG